MQKIQYIEINALKPNPKNPRIIKNKQFKILCESIRENIDYFETRPILCNSQMIVFAGHQRLEAAKKIGLKKVPVAVMDISLERQTELMLRDNRTNGDWDFDMLKELDIDLLQDVGFDEGELKELSGDMLEKLEQKEEQIKSYKKIHILISIDVKKMQDAQAKLKYILEELSKTDGVEIEQSAN